MNCAKRQFLRGERPLPKASASQSSTPVTATKILSPATSRRGRESHDLT